MTSFLRPAVLTTAAFVVLTSLATAGSASASEPVGTVVSPCAVGTTSGAARSQSTRADDHEDLTASEIRRIERTLDTRLAALGKAARGASTPISVHVHVIDGNTYRGPSRADIGTQVNTMNAAYSGGQSSTNAPANFRFVLKTFERVKNQKWLTAGLKANGAPDDASKTMRNRLHTAGPAALNLYFTKPGGGLLGYSSFPQAARNNLRQDGVTIHSESLAGGNISGYKRGDTAVHEIGHWLGLYHTFQGGCSAGNDMVGDTPREAGPSYRCNQTNTCSAPGADPIHNFMDYSYDNCMYEFTDGQVRRMQDAWTVYRAPR